MKMGQALLQELAPTSAGGVDFTFGGRTSALPLILSRCKVRNKSGFVIHLVAVFFIYLTNRTQNAKYRTIAATQKVQASLPARPAPQHNTREEKNVLNTCSCTSSHACQDGGKEAQDLNSDLFPIHNFRYCSQSTKLYASVMMLFAIVVPHSTKIMASTRSTIVFMSENLIFSQELMPVRSTTA